MKKAAVSIICVLFFYSGYLQAQGIVFVNKTFTEVQKQAKAENKLIFIDFHTKWCAPCRAMEKNVFPQKEAGDFYNAAFINLELDAENEGVDLARKYNVNAYPTLAFVNAEGELIFKNVGAADVKSLIRIGKKALEASQGTASYATLKKLYPSKSNDEIFLITYIDKMIEFKETPITAIEKYLDIQKGMKENESEMLEFILKHYSSRLILGGKAEKILNEHYQELWDIATPKEEKFLEKVKLQMIKTTRKYAYSTKDTALYAIFLNRYMELPDSIKTTDFALRRETYNDYWLEYLWISGNKKKYKIAAEKYLDSVTTAKTLDQIRHDDNLRYEAYNEKLQGNKSLIGDQIKESLKYYEAIIQTEAIIKVGEAYLATGLTKPEIRRLKGWINYGMKLLPESYLMSDFLAKVLYRTGDKKEALKAKKAAIAKLPANDSKILPVLKKELSIMEKGGSF